jgi:hypothetical protein
MDEVPPADRDGLRRWLETWQRTGPLLEAERFERLARMTDDEARRQTRMVFQLWRKSPLDDSGAELVEQQRWFMAAAHRPRRR